MPKQDAAAKAKQQRQGCGCLLGFVIIVALIALISSAAGGSSKTPTFNGSNASAEAVTKSVVNGDEDSPGLAKPPRARCGGPACTIMYTIKEPTGISTSLELIDPTRGVFKALFKDPSIHEVVVEVIGPTTSIGGKSSNSQLFSLSCNRQAANQIDWDNVGADGLKTLCVYQPVAKGL